MKIRYRQDVASGGLRETRRRGIAAGAVLAIALALPVGAMGDQAPESVNGSGAVAATHFSISVSGGPFGQDPSGSLELQGFFNFTATPTCMNIADNAGVVGFRIDNGAMEGRGFLAASEPDASGRTVQYSAVLTAPPTACPPDDAPPPPGATENGGGGSVFSGQITDSGGPVNPLPLSRQQFSTTAAPTGARSIAQAQDGTVWFIEPEANRLVSISDDASGTMHEYSVPTADAGISSIAPDLASCTTRGCLGGMWFTESNSDRLGHVSPNGTISEYSLPTPAAQPSAIAGDPAGGAWFTAPGADRVGHVSGAGGITEYQLPTREADPVAITAAGETDPTAGGAWFVEKAAKRIGFIDGNRRVSEHPLPVGAGAPTAIVPSGSAGGAGAWFLEPSANTIGHIDPRGDIDQYPIPTANASPRGLASGAGPDASSNGAWFSETSTGQLGFISSSGQFTEFTIPGASPGAITFAPTVDVPSTDGYSRFEAVWWADSVARNVGFATFPLNISSGAPLVPAPPAPSYVRITLARQVKVRGGRMRLKLGCQGQSGDCTGRVMVAVAEPHTASVTAPVAAARFSIIPNHHRTLVLKLNRKALKLLRTHRRGMPVTVDISPHGRFIASSTVATLRLG